MTNWILLRLALPAAVCFCQLMPVVHGATTDTIKYDSLRRLTNAMHSDGSGESYSHDAAGNRITRIRLAATNHVDSTPPSVPTNFVSLVFSSSELSVRWNRASDTGGSGLAGYSIFVNGALAATTTSTNFVLNGLVPGTNYCLALNAYDRANNPSALTPVLCFVTSATNDTTPPILTLLSPTNGSVLLTNFVIIAGVATDSTRGNNGISSVIVNAQAATDSVTTLNSTSQWNSVVSLLPGYNPIRVIASDASSSQNRVTNEMMLLRGLRSNEPPVTVGVRTSPDGYLETQLVGHLGTKYSVWASTNLTDWIFLQDVALSNWVQIVTDSERANHPHRFYRFSLAAPEVLLKRTGLPITFQPLAVGDEGYLFGAAESGLFAIDSVSLTQVWGNVMPAGCRKFPYSPLSVSSNGIVFGVADWNECGNGRLAAFSSTNGLLLWEHTAGGPHPRHVAALHDGYGVLYHGANPFFEIDYNSQEEHWKFTNGLFIGDKGIAIDFIGIVYTGWHGGADGNSLLAGFRAPLGISTPHWSLSFPGPDGPVVSAVIGVSSARARLTSCSPIFLLLKNCAKTNSS